MSAHEKPKLNMICIVVSILITQRLKLHHKVHFVFTIVSIRTRCTDLERNETEILHGIKTRSEITKLN